MIKKRSKIDTSKKSNIDTSIGRDFAKGLALELGRMKWNRPSKASGKARRRARKGHRPRVA